MPKKITPAFIKSICAMRNANLNYGKPFYAEELNLNGGQISALSCARVIRPTGNSKKSYYDLDDTHARICHVKEWRVDARNFDYAVQSLYGESRRLRDRIDSHKESINKMEDALSALRNAGFSDGRCR